MTLWTWIPEAYPTTWIFSKAQYIVYKESNLDWQSYSPIIRRQVWISHRRFKIIVGETISIPTQENIPIITWKLIPGIIKRTGISQHHPGAPDTYQ